MGISYAEYEPEDMPGYVKTIVVANYYPPGNVESNFSENIQEPRIAEGQMGRVQQKIEEYRQKKARRTANKSIFVPNKKFNIPGKL